MKRKEPSDLRINYPSNRAKPGQKAKARSTALAASQKTFRWHCPAHGMALFSTAGSGACRQCLAATQRATKQRARENKNTSAAVANPSKSRDET